MKTCFFISTISLLLLLLKDHRQTLGKGFYLLLCIKCLFAVLYCLYYCFLWTGLSLKTQEITALFLAARLACSVLMELDAHSVLDMATLISTAWVIYMIRFKLKSTYIKELDNMPLYYLVKTLFFYNIVLNVIKH